MGRKRTIRRAVVALAMVVGVLTSGPAPAGAVAPTATVTPASGGLGVPGALATTRFDLATVGYAGTEVLLEGGARTFAPVPPSTLTADGLWTIAPSAATQPFRTRAVVYRPADPADFNGVVVVEWLNVSNQYDSAVDWLLAHNELIRQGVAYVGVTAQALGVTAAKAADPARYATLVHPGDNWSYDVFSQVGNAVRSDPAVLGGLAPAKVVAAGQSQSANRLATYIDAVHPLDQVFDGYYVHSRIGPPAPLRTGPPGPLVPPINLVIRADLGVPVVTVQSEADIRLIRQPDSGTYRHWEVAGGAHTDSYLLNIGQFDDGTSNTTAVTLFDRMLHPTNEPVPGSLAPCTYPVNAGPVHWTTQATLHHLVEWVRVGTVPPSGAVLTMVGPDLAYDANGNTLGGLRSPHVDAPVAVLHGTNAGPASCTLFGRADALTPAQLEALYPSHSAFLAAWNGAVDAAVASGSVLPLDAPKLRASAVGSNVGLRVPEAPSIIRAGRRLGGANVWFHPPGGADDAFITGYTATCTDVRGTTASTSGPSSPLLVTGLHVLAPSTCTVRATNAVGDGPESAPCRSKVIGRCADPD